VVVVSLKRERERENQITHKAYSTLSTLTALINKRKKERERESEL